MPGIQYLALLRGINVGGKNIIRMTDLKACFEALGFSDVLTYIQSGNVLFKSAQILYFSRLISKATQSHLSRIVLLPVYQSMTIRNWNTTTKLLALVEKESP